MESALIRAPRFAFFFLFSSLVNWLRLKLHPHSLRPEAAAASQQVRSLYDMLNFPLVKSEGRLKLRAEPKKNLVLDNRSVLEGRGKTI